jgi:phosphatidate cytidylyltransferase
LDRATASEGAGAEGPTGGGPPVAPRPRRSAPEAGQSGRASQEGASSIGLRVGTGIAVAVVALVAFKLGTVPALVLCVIVVTFAAGECYGVLRRAGYHPATLLGLVGTVSLMIGAYSKGVAALPLVLVLITAFTLIWYLVGIERGSPVAGTAATMLTVGWISLLGAYAGLLLSPSLFPDRHGIAFLLGAIIATVANDVGALVVGGWMGRHPLARSISPNKTWEGLVGGSIFTVLVSTVAIGAIHPWTPATAALLGLVVVVVAPIGDLCESLLKRDLRLKDMGTLLPGHGGVLDRVDALLFVLPATYYLVRALNIA